MNAFKGRAPPARLASMARTSYKVYQNFGHVAVKRNHSFPSFCSHDRNLCDRHGDEFCAKGEGAATMVDGPEVGSYTRTGSSWRLDKEAKWDRRPGSSACLAKVEDSAPLCRISYPSELHTFTKVSGFIPRAHGRSIVWTMRRSAISCIAPSVFPRV